MLKTDLSAALKMTASGGTKFVEARRAGSDDGVGEAEGNHRAVMLIGAWMRLIRATKKPSC